MNIAVFAGGCFWEPEDVYARLQGVVETEVGYTGGTSSHPTYHNLDDHCEATKVVFDSRKVAYEELLRTFWKLHDPTAEYENRYRSVIFYTDETQKTAAEHSLKEVQQHYSDPVLTIIEPASAFYKAEDYHQRYLAKLRGEL